MRDSPLPLLFLVTGAVAGAANAIVGRLLPVMLTLGAGSFLFIAIICCAAMVGRATAESRVNVRVAVITIVGYPVALLAFNLGLGWSQDFTFITPSGDILDFRSDVWIAFCAAAVVAIAGMTLIVRVLARRWRLSVIGSAIGAALLAIASTYAINAGFHTYWSFFVPLFTIGDALFCFLVGRELTADDPPAAAARTGTG